MLSELLPAEERIRVLLLVPADHLDRDRLAYDLKVPLTDLSLAATGEPRRGDVVTFHSPRDGTRLIKRIVGLPGDTVALRGDVLYVNGVAARYSDPVRVTESVPGWGEQPAVRVTERIAGSARVVQYLPDVRAMRDFGPVAVPRGSYFMMGDNRDDSADSRFIGPVRRDLIIGRTSRLLVSADILGHWMPRPERFGKALD